MKTIKINFLKVGTPLLLLMGLLTFNTSFAQNIPPAGGEQMQQPVKEDYTEAEIKSFISANEKIAVAQQETEQQMIADIEASDIAVDRFNEILMAQQNPEQEVEVSDDEQASFDKAAEKVMSHQQTLQTKMVSAIEEEGLEVNQYQQMMMAYQQSPKVKQQIDKIISAENPQPQESNE